MKTLRLIILLGLTIASAHAQQVVEASQTQTNAGVVGSPYYVSPRRLASYTGFGSYLPLAGGTMTGNITFNDPGEGVILPGGSLLSGASGYGLHSASLALSARTDTLLSMPAAGVVQTTTASNTVSTFRLDRTVNTAATWDFRIPAGSTNLVITDGTFSLTLNRASSTVTFSGASNGLVTDGPGYTSNGTAAAPSKSYTSDDDTGDFLLASNTPATTGGGITRVFHAPPKSLTNNSATAIVNCVLASNTAVAGVVRYSVEVFDGTDVQIEEGVISYHATNKAGAIANNTVVKFGNQQAMTSGTLTCTWTITAANPAVLTLNANSSLTPSAGYPRVTYTLDNLTQQAVTPQ